MIFELAPYVRSSENSWNILLLGLRMAPHIGQNIDPHFDPLDIVRDDLYRPAPVTIEWDPHDLHYLSHVARVRYVLFYGKIP